MTVFASSWNAQGSLAMQRRKAMLARIEQLRALQSVPPARVQNRGPFLRGAGSCCRVSASSQGSRRLACPFFRPLRLRHRGETIDLRVRELARGMLEVEQGGATRVLTPSSTSAVHLAGTLWHVQAGAVDLMVDDLSFEPADEGGGSPAASELRAPFNGEVISVQAVPGARVTRGDTLLVLESMKLEHVLAATRDAIVKAVHVRAGQQAATVQVLVTYEAAA